MWKVALAIGTIGLSLCVATDAFSRGHSGGGGGRGFHSSGGFRSAPHVSSFRASRVSSFHSHGHSVHSSHVRVSHVSHSRSSHAHVSNVHHDAAHHVSHEHKAPNPALAHAVIGVAHGHHVGPRPGGVQHAAHQPFHAHPRAFAAHRVFLAGHPFFRFAHIGWHPFHHLGWVGPLFWPLAYGDFFYYALWPDDYGYEDPFWVYGYGDIYTTVFSPYDYSEYVQQPAKMTALTKQMAQSCGDEATEVTGWPIDQIKEVIKPDGQQNLLLDELGNAVVKASEIIKANCPTSVSFTPLGRLTAMQQRLQALVQAVAIVQPALTGFYDSLNDEQKAKFNSMKPAPDTQVAQQDDQDTDAALAGQLPTSTEAPSQQAACSAVVLSWPSEQINQIVQPTDAQRAKLSSLQSSAETAANLLQASCPTDIPATPPERLALVGKRLAAILQGVQLIQPAMQDFYASLNDSQKSRFNTIGQHLYASVTTP